MNIFRNWHKPSKWYRCKTHKLSDIYPASASSSNKGVEVYFQDEYGMEMRFTLNHNTAKHLQMKLNDVIAKQTLQQWKMNSW